MPVLTVPRRQPPPPERRSAIAVQRAGWSGRYREGEPRRKQPMVAIPGQKRGDGGSSIAKGSDGANTNAEDSRAVSRELFQFGDPEFPRHPERWR